jgi:hypothetical protein
MTDIPDDSLYDFLVVFCLEGITKRFEYEVSKGTFDRVREALEDEDIGNITFEACRPSAQIVVNSRFVQLVRFLWQPKNEGEASPGDVGPVEDTGPDAGDVTPGHDDTIDLYFTGREEPLRLNADDPEEVFDLVLAMETEAFSRCSIADIGREEAVLDLRKLVCAELPLGLAQQGEANALFDLEEEA